MSCLDNDMVNDSCVHVTSGHPGEVGNLLRMAPGSPAQELVRCSAVMGYCCCCLWVVFWSGP